MTSRTTKLIALLMVLAMLCAALSACGSTAAEAPASQTEASAPQAEAPAEEAAEPAAEAEEPAAEAEASAEETAEEPVEEEEPFFPLEETEEISIWTAFPSDMAQYAESQEDFHYTKNVEERLNIDLVITSVSDREVDTLFPLMLATGDYQDIMMFGKYTGSYEAAATDGIILDCTDYVEEYCPNYTALVKSDPVGLISLTSDDGHYYCFYGVYKDGAPVQNGLLTRGDWMKEAGFDKAPSTIDGIEDYLMALRDAGHPNALWMDSNGAYFSNILSGAFGVSTGWGCNPFILDDGKVVCSALQPGMKDYLETMSRWYTNDLIDKDFATNFAVYMTDIGDVLNGKVGIWVDVGDRIPAIVEQIDVGEKMDPQAIPYPTLNEGEENHYVLFREHNRGTLALWAVSGTCENVELVLRFLDYGFTDEGYLLYNWGVEGDSFTVDETGKKFFTDEVINFPMGLSRGLEMYAVSYMPSVYDYDVDEVKNAGCAEEVQAWSGSAGDGANLLSLNNLTTEENEIVNGTAANDYNTYYKEQALKFMTGELNFESDWDTFIQNVSAMSVDDICDAYQAAYDRMTEKIAG